MKSTDEWETPPELFSFLHERFKFTIDAAATEGNKKLPKFTSDCFHYEFDSSDRVFCNPPYSQAKDFTLFFRNLWIRKNVSSLLLLPVRTDRLWWHKAILDARVEWYTGRLRFSGSKNSAFMYSVNFIYGFKDVLTTKTLNAGGFGGTNAKT